MQIDGDDYHGELDYKGKVSANTYVYEEKSDQDSEMSLRTRALQKRDRCAAVGHRLSIGVPGSKIPSWFEEQQHGCTVALRLPPMLHTQVIGFAICGVFHGNWTYDYPRIIFRIVNDKKVVPKLEVDHIESAATENCNIWVTYIPFGFFQQMYHDLQPQDWSHIQGSLVMTLAKTNGYDVKVPANTYVYEEKTDEKDSNLRRLGSRTSERRELYNRAVISTQCSGTRGMASISLILQRREMTIQSPKPMIQSPIKHVFEKVDISINKLGPTHYCVPHPSSLLCTNSTSIPQSITFQTPIDLLNVAIDVLRFLIVPNVAIDLLNMICQLAANDMGQDNDSGPTKHVGLLAHEGLIVGLFTIDEPEGKAHASSDLFFQSTAFVLIVFPLLPFINSITSFLISSLFTSLSISIATPHLLQLNQLFGCWSAKNGQQSIGTPLEMLSIAEFHPLCVKNPPIDGCFRTCSWGHQLAKNPLSFVSTKKSGGSTALSPITRSGRIIHKNG
ncbi:hypothetical protein Ccrd_013714 [Cynara cardunculus var. scolymus]|uniref:C-JID domain-containing protein n=1 Tax=Cynara cardunculus var. scolymus TaxID=59895 RepID=A0A103YF39_CYNCS|nr:hypothetical protein Ccrd_013714 [Cynara cardunculus var. scolymus]